MLISITSEAKGLLKRGEHKSLQTDRVVLVPGPEDEMENLRRIYELFTRDGFTERQIAQRLNGESVVNVELGRPWTAAIVHQMFTNEKISGTISTTASPSS